MKRPVALMALLLSAAACESSALIGVYNDRPAPAVEQTVDAGADAHIQPQAAPDSAIATLDTRATGPDVASCDAAEARLVTVTLQPGPEGKDAVVSSAFASRTYPEYSTLEARGWTWSGVEGAVRGLLQFDLSAVPVADVTSAEITLRGDPREPNPPYFFGHQALDGAQNDGWLLRVLEPWQEATATWDLQPKAAEVPATASAAAATEAVYLPPSTSQSQTYVINVTAIINEMIKGQLPNHGFLLRLATEEPYRMLSFHSSDHTEPNARPMLTITYRVPGC